MDNYSWIKPGVKAIIVDCVNYPILLGRVVTCKSIPHTLVSHSMGYTWLGVLIEEGRAFARELDIVHYDMISPRASSLRPLKGDEDLFRREQESEKPVPAKTKDKA